MSVLETIYPDGDVSAGSWAAKSAGALYAEVDESGAHDGDTSYDSLSQIGLGVLDSSFEVSLSTPGTTWTDPQVRDGETWKIPSDLQVRDGESWKPVQSLKIRDGESWKLVIPQIVVRITCKQVTTSGTPAFSGSSVSLRNGAASVGSVSLSLTEGTWVETVLTVPAASLLGVTPGDFRVRVHGSINCEDAGDQGELRVTQIKVELND